MRFKKTRDHGLLTKLHERCFPGEWIPKSEDWDESEMWLIYEGKTPIGFTGIQCYGNGHYFLFRTGVLKSHQGKGIHRAAIRYRLRILKRRPKAHRAFTYTNDENWASIKNLLVCGFRYYPSDWAGKGFFHFQVRF